MTEEPKRNKINEPIRVTGDWLPEDFILGQNLAYPLTQMKKLSLIGMGLFMVGAGSSTFIFREDTMSHVMGGLVIGIAPFIGLGPFWVPTFMARLRVKQMMSESNGCDIQIVESGLRWLHLKDPVTKEWEKWYAAIVHEELIVLFVNARKFEVVPKRLFENDEQYQQAFDLVKEKVGSVIDMTGK